MFCHLNKALLSKDFYKLHIGSVLPPLKAHCQRSYRLFLTKAVMCYFILGTEVNYTLKRASWVP